MISRRFMEAVKLANEPAYRIAWRAGIHPATLSKIIHGAERVSQGDRRVLAVARVLGLVPDECFEPDPKRAREGEERTATGKGQ